MRPSCWLRSLKGLYICNVRETTCRCSANDTHMIFSNLIISNVIISHLDRIPKKYPSIFKILKRTFQYCPPIFSCLLETFLFTKFLDFCLSGDIKYSTHSKMYLQRMNPE